MQPKAKIVPRLLITLLGIALIFMGTSGIVLKITGKSAPAVITDIRRVGGERTDAIPGRYTYDISYTFTLPDGKKINGYTKKIGDSVYFKADGKTTTLIKYLPGFPYINALEQETGLGTGQLVLILAGGFLIYLINR